MSDEEKNPDMDESDKEIRDLILVELSEDPVGGLAHYCHEGLKIEADGQFMVARICSLDSKELTAKAAISSLVLLVRNKVLEGSQGC